MNYDINLESLKQKNSDFQNLNNDVNTLKSSFSSNYINTLSSSEISSVTSKVSESVNRLSTAYNNCGQWFQAYCQDLEALENNLASFSAKDVTALLDFKGEFNNIFSKSTIPTIKTGGDKTALNKVNNEITQAVNATDYLNPGNLSGAKLEFINSIIQGAIETYNKYGILPSLTLAQAALETGWGEHKIGNNIFGVKANETWTGKTKTVWTDEYKNGKKIHIQDTFKDYDSISDSIMDHAQVLLLNRYKGVIAAKEYKEACRQVKAGGYATSPVYDKSLINLIEKYGLNQWDPKTT